MQLITFCVGYYPILPADGLLALEKSLEQNFAAISIIGCLSWPKLLRAPGRKSDNLYEEFRKDEFRKEAFPSEKKPHLLREAESSQAIESEEIVRNEKEKFNVERILEDILTGILGCTVSKDQPLMEVSASL